MIHHDAVSIRHFLATVLLCTGISNAQNPLPLENGNMWEYRSSDPMDPSRLRMAVTGDTVLPNSRNYFVLSGSLFMSPYLRLDSSRVYAYSVASSSEFKLFDFLAQPGDTITFLNGGAQTILLQSSWFDTTVNRYFWYFVLYQGQPPNWYEFVEWSIQDSLGLVFLRGEPGMSWYLTGARIVGDTIGTLTTVTESAVDLPEQPILLQNYPNPFNPTTTISYWLPVRSYVAINLFTITGQKVATIVSAHESEGVKSAAFNASGLASGIYIYRIHATPEGGNRYSRFVASRKMILVK